MSPVLTLILSFAILIMWLLVMSHAHVQGADFAILERLHDCGLIGHTTTKDDYRTLSYLLTTVAPAQYARQQRWITMYFHSLAIAQSVLRHSRIVEQEMRRVVAFQAVCYAKGTNQVLNAR